MAKSLDLAFVIDATASMSKFIDVAYNNISNIVGSIDQSGFSVRFGLVEYRDHEPQNQGFITRRNDFTSSLNTMQNWLKICAKIKDGVPADICFVLDSSGSIGADNFRKMLNFVRDTVSNLAVEPDMINVAVVTYSNQIRTDVPLSSNRNLIFQQIPKISYMGGGTPTALGLDQMNRILQSGRKRVQKIGILLTDGASDNMNATIQAALSAKQNHVRILAIGITSHVNFQELRAIASNEQRVFNVESFDSLIQVKKQILDDVTGGTSDGGDEPEALEDGLRDALTLSWKSDIRMCVLVADQPPHGLSHVLQDNYPAGCPDGYEPMKIANEMAEKSIRLHVIGCEPSATPYRDFFMALASVTGGKYIPLTNCLHLTEIIKGVAQEELSQRDIMESVQNCVLQNKIPGSNRVKAIEISDQLSKKFEKANTCLKLLQMNGGNLPVITEMARRFARYEAMADIKREFRELAGTNTNSSVQAASFEIVNVKLDMMRIQRMVQSVLITYNLQAEEEEEE